MSEELDKMYLDKAAEYAKTCSTCLKVAVGSVFVPDDTYEKPLYSANSGAINCKEQGECHKFKVTGIYESCEEIHMLDNLKENNIDPKSGTIYVTRYPCVNCARKVAESRVKKVVYGGRQEISDEVKGIFNRYSIPVEWYPECDYED